MSARSEFNYIPSMLLELENFTNDVLSRSPRTNFFTFSHEKIAAVPRSTDTSRSFPYRLIRDIWLLFPLH